MNRKRSIESVYYKGEMEQKRRKSEHTAECSELVEFYEPHKPNGYLSNYYGKRNDSKFQLTINDRSWKSVEHFFQAQKFVFEECSEKSLQYANLIADASTPNIAKELATQKVKGGYP